MVLAMAAAVNVAMPITQDNEGYRGAAYRDPANVLTQCYGETENINPSKIYSKDQCATKLRARLNRDYAPVLAKCMPVFVGADWQKYTNMYGSLLDTSYNVGPERVCTKFAPLVNTGRYVDACRSLPGWFVTAKDRKSGIRKTFPGLVKRRNQESSLCLNGVPL
jgi:lysozyme